VCICAVVASRTCRLVHRFHVICDPVVTPSVSGMWSTPVAGRKWSGVGTVRPGGLGALCTCNRACRALCSIGNRRLSQVSERYESCRNGRLSTESLHSSRSDQGRSISRIGRRSRWQRRRNGRRRGPVVLLHPRGWSSRASQGSTIGNRPGFGHARNQWCNSRYFLLRHPTRCAHH